MHKKMNPTKEYCCSVLKSGNLALFVRLDVKILIIIKIKATKLGKKLSIFKSLCYLFYFSSSKGPCQFAALCTAHPAYASIWACLQSSRKYFDSHVYTFQMWNLSTNYHQHFICISIVIKIFIYIYLCISYLLYLFNRFQPIAFKSFS